MMLFSIDVLDIGYRPPLVREIRLIWGGWRRGRAPALIYVKQYWDAGQQKTAAIAGGRFHRSMRSKRLREFDHRDEDIRSWQDWQRPTLPSLET